MAGKLEKLLTTQSQAHKLVVIFLPIQPTSYLQPLGEFGTKQTLGLVILYQGAISQELACFTPMTVSFTSQLITIRT